jgi:threonine dehydrogenase-like Zn-dependent dehydrogenase
MLQLARMQGAVSVILIDPLEGRRRRVESLGADWVIDPNKEEPAAAIRSQYPDGIEVVFDCSGNVQAIEQALRIVMRGGTVMLYGVCDQKDQLEINPFWINDAEITIRGSYNNPNTMGRAVDLLSSRKLDAEAVVTHHFPLIQAPEAFASVGSSESSKVMINPAM